MKKNTSVVFDLDGTLLDSPNAGKYRVSVLLAINGISFGKDEREKFFSQWGRPVIPMLMDTLGISEDHAALINKQWEIWDTVDPVSLIDGAREIVSWSREACGGIALFTSRHTENTGELLRALDLLDSFSLSVGLEGDTKRRFFSPSYEKKDPRSFVSIAEYMRREHGTEEVVYVGDTVFDVGYARNAGLTAVAVLSGGTSFEDFRNMGVLEKDILSSVKDIPGWIQGI